MSTLTYAKVRRFFEHDQKELFNNKIAISIDESNFYIVHFLFAGTEKTGFEGGYYYGIMILDQEHPFKAPTQYMLSPSGRFVFAPKYPPNSDYAICTSNTGFHQENWSPQTSLEQYLIGWRSFFTDKGTETRGIGSLNTTDEEKLKIAKTTRAYILKISKFKEVFPEIYQTLLNDENPFPDHIVSRKQTTEKKLDVSEKMKNLGLDSDSEDDKPKKKKIVKKSLDSDSEEEPKKKKIVKKVIEEKPKKKSKKDSDSEEEKPKKKSSKKAIDTDSEEEKPKKKSSRKAIDTDSEEEKPKKKSSKKVIDSESEEEKPKKKKKKKVVSSDSDSD